MNRTYKLALAVLTFVHGAGLFAWGQVQSVTPLQLMTMVEQHARKHGATYRPILSPSESVMSAMSMTEVQKAGYPVVVWTVNDRARMQQLFDLGVDGIISDRPDLLRDLVEKNSTARGGLTSSESLLDSSRFDAVGHRGSGSLRPESTFPAFEVALDNLATNLETDIGITSDGVPILSHETSLNPQTCRESGNSSYTAANKLLIKDLAFAQIRSRFLCDKVFRPEQKNDLALSPVARQFAEKKKLPSAFVHPTVSELFEFVRFYEQYYTTGEGSKTPGAAQRGKNAARVHFKLEIKINRLDPEQTVSPSQFVDALAGAITEDHMEARSEIQSFDFRPLVLTQAKYPSIRTAYLVGSQEQLKISRLPAELQPTEFTSASGSQPASN